MTPRQLDELRSISIGQAEIVINRLKRAGREYGENLMDAYEERLAIITEGRDVQPEDISAAWESVLRIKFADFGYRDKTGVTRKHKMPRNAPRTCLG